MSTEAGLQLPDDAPTVRYYRHHHGRWSGDITFRITGWSVFWNARLSWLDRMMLLSMGLMPRAFGAVRMATEVDATRATHGEVVHHTEVGKLGMVMYRSREVFLLHADGVGMDLVRVQRQWPRLGRPLPEDFGTASVTADGTGARYDWLWYDRRMEQLTRPVPGGLEVTQRSDWSTTHVVLRRLG